MGKVFLNPLYALVAALALTGPSISAAEKVDYREYAGRKMVEYQELKRGDFSVNLTSWGATLLSVILPDNKGHLADVVLGYDVSHTIAGYVFDNTSFGAVVGRVANRIAGARFTLNGRVYRLYPNNGNNTLHGGHRGFANVLWSVKDVQGGDFPSVTYYYRSFDGEQGFPGNLDVFVTYKITADYELRVEMVANPLDKPTPVNLAQHAYWNLGGHDSGTILSHTVQIFASHVTPTDAALIPTGEIRAVAGTAFDLRQPHTVGSRIAEAGGYDINYVLDSAAPSDGTSGFRKVAVVKEPKSGRVMQLWANQPGVQFYTSNMLRNAVGKGGYVYQQYDGLCLETQGFPNAVNQPNFPSQTVYPGQVYNHTMLFKFSVE